MCRALYIRIYKIEMVSSLESMENQQNLELQPESPRAPTKTPGALREPYFLLKISMSVKSLKPQQHCVYFVFSSE